MGSWLDRWSKGRGLDGKERNLQGLDATTSRHRRHGGRRLLAHQETRRGGLKGAIRLLLRRPQTVQLLSRARDEVLQPMDKRSSIKFD